MSKYYLVEVKLNSKTWVTVKSETRQADALTYVKNNMSEHNRYPIRVVRVVRTTVFEGH